LNSSFVFECCSCNFDADLNKLLLLKDLGKLLLGGSSKCDQLKVFLCGAGEAGKTTLVRALDGTPKKYQGLDATGEVENLINRTRGISLVDSNCGLPDCQFRIYDLGGQPTFHALHSRFMANDVAMFVYVGNMTSSSQEFCDSLHYWLRFIRTHYPLAAKPAVLLVASHADVKHTDYTNEGNSINAIWESIHATFKEHINFVKQGFVELDCREYGTTGVHTIRQALRDVYIDFVESDRAIDIPNICKSIRAIIRREIVRSNVKCLPWKRFVDLVRPDLPPTDDSILESAARFLHKMGDIYMYANQTSDVLIIIDLPWFLQNGIGWAFCSSEILQAHDQSAWNLFKQEASRRPVPIETFLPQSEPAWDEGPSIELIVVDMMRKFGLCYDTNWSQFPNPERDSCILDMEYEPRFTVFPDFVERLQDLSKFDSSQFISSSQPYQVECTSEVMCFPPGFFAQIQSAISREIGFHVEQESFSGRESVAACPVWPGQILCGNVAELLALVQLELNVITIQILSKYPSDRLRSGSVEHLKARLDRAINSVGLKYPGLQLHYSQSTVALPIDPVESQPVPMFRKRSQPLRASKRPKIA
jgi:GTPase SAR1 family protein